MSKWILDAYTSEDRIYIVSYDEASQVLDNQLVNLYFHGYILGGEPEKLVYELRGVEGVEDAWIEKWRFPPFYDSQTSITVFKTKSILVLRTVQKVATLRGLKVVNNAPHPLIEALYRSRLRPLTKIKTTNNGRVELFEWSPYERDPVVNYVIVYLENGFYTARTRDSTVWFTKLEDLASYLSSSNGFHLGFIDPYTYTRLVEAEPEVSKITRWITGGSFSPHEYFEWSRLSYTPLSLMNNITIGRVLTTIEALIARDRKLVIDKSIGRREEVRSMSELVVYDRGGVVYEPKPGLYWSICQVDFKSLYPSIIARYNVSGETVNKPICNKILRLDWTPHSICLDEEGVVPSSIKELIELKDLYDDLYKRTRDPVYAERKNAVKWILVASFGYLGYRNSIFGSVMAHEVVTSTSREVMKKARIAVMKEGYRVIHAIVDSVFIESVKTLEECICLKEKIEEITGFKAKIEALYTWLYIPRSLNSDEAVANRYYGLLIDGSMKIKGILATRRDTPLFVKKAQLEAISKLSEAKTPSEYLDRVIEAHRVIDRYIDVLKTKSFDIYELVVTRFSKARGEYIKPPVYVSMSNPPYRLVYVDSGLIPLERVGNKRIDIDKYIELLEKARRELPFIKPSIFGQATRRTSVSSKLITSN
ncbi:MAG: DNA polymerase domain-containing protein [Desulfurococcaceae archaeon]